MRLTLDPNSFLWWHVKSNTDSAPNLIALAEQAMINAGFDIDLDAADKAELNAAVSRSPLDNVGKEKDLRNLQWSSIDNADSEDLDQVEYVERLNEHGKFRLYVGIADVDACVKKGGLIDAFAARNATSVYTGVHVFPMLPNELSAGRTSLRPGADREAMVMEIDVAEDGSADNFDVYFAVVRNQAKLVYEHVSAWLKDGLKYEALDAVPGMAEQIELQEQVCQRLRAANERAGALSVQTIEASPVTKDGAVVDFKITETNRARDMIQSFMVTMNSALARFMDERGSAIIQRVVKEPQRWPKLVELAASFGTELPAEPDAVALSKFVESRRRAEPQKFHEFSLTIVKLLGPGQYVVHVPGETNEGHFGLAVHEYTHATAPNRRYADLVIQRQVKALACRDGTSSGGVRSRLEAGAPREEPSVNDDVHGKDVVGDGVAREEPPLNEDGKDAVDSDGVPRKPFVDDASAPYTVDELAAIAKHCMDRENAARKVERSIRKSAAAVLLAPQVGKEFDAIITGASAKGVFVRLLKPPAEGRVTTKEHNLDVGDKVRVKLLSTDYRKGYIDFEFIQRL